MGKQVKIRVTGFQDGMSGEETVTEAYGNMLYREPYYYVSYEEKLDRQSRQGSKTVLCFSKDRLRVTRKGEVESLLEFAKGVTHNSLYMTQYGSLEVELMTEKLDIDCHEKGARLEAEYRIAFYSMPPTRGRLSIHIEEI